MEAKISDYLEMDGRKLYYEMAGEGEVLVLAHAGFLDSGMWDGQWDAFAQHYRVVRYDLGGYGKSDPVQGPVSRRDELLRLLKHVGVESAYLLGCSVGGEMVVDFTLEHPEMVLGLIAVSAPPSGFEMQGEPPAEILEMIEAMQKGDLDRVSELQIRLWIDGPYRQPQEVDLEVRQRAARMNQIAVANQTWAIADTQPIDLLMPPAVDRLQEIQVPALILAGALDNSEVLRGADVMAEGIQGAKKMILEGCAHVPNMEKPAEFNEIVLSFLRNG